MKENLELSKKVRLFVDAHVFDGIPQGTVTFIAGIYSELVKDDRFVIYVGSSDYEKAQNLLQSNKFIHLEYKTHSKYIRLLYSIPALLKKHKIAYAHFQYITPLYKPCKYIVTIHDLLFLDFPKSFPLTYRIKNSLLFRLSGKRADILTTVSHYSAKAIEKHFRINRKKIIITPNSPNLSSIKQQEALPILERKSFILYVSRIEPRKNQALLLKIWKELKLSESNLHLVFVGASGVDDPNLSKTQNNLSKEEQAYVHWLSHIPNKQLNWLYNNCKLFVFPSEAEGFGIPPLEAAVCGAKVLCSNRTAMEDYTFFGDFMFDPRSETEFKEKMNFALKSEFPHNYVMSAIRETYDWKNIARGFANEIINKNAHK